MKIKALLLMTTLVASQVYASAVSKFPTIEDPTAFKLVSDKTKRSHSGILGCGGTCGGGK